MNALHTVTTPEAEDVLAMAGEVWATFLGEEPLLPAGPAEQAPGWSAAVTVTGAWPGMVVIELSTAAAHAVATRMLGTPQADEADTTDAVGELVNIVGGNVKSLMPEPSVLSLPVVTTGRIAVPTGQVEVVRLDLEWLGEPVALRVHAHDDSTEGGIR
ncbi:chemotaxis protein CheX [Nocardioides sp. AE5]|uniref:chemotaxis protein CheX n=1 Tax=Nocardioides sp. AE5 TaxID=2962573 RepID=UPI0028816CC0|nr:chemotaxis protein CheX [Nocardioides sp. AE5]MDT0200809.1 chemotaxis protein CheX [Nocardioides sp. AE5]